MADILTQSTVGATSSADSSASQQILTEYAKLKERILQIENKYSMTYLPPDLTFPPTLGLTHLTHTQISDEDLAIQAENLAGPAFIEKQRALDSSYQKSSASLSERSNRYNAALKRKLAAIDRQQANALKDVECTVAKNGVVRSSVGDRLTAQVKADFDRQRDEVKAYYSTLTAELNRRQAAILAYYQNASDDLSKAKQAKVESNFFELVKQRKKNYDDVQKYNSQVDEKEARYQVSCQKAINAAKEQEYARGLEASRLYASMGETAVQEQILTEKYHYSRMFFTGWSKADALAAVQSDSFMRSQLGSYYSSLIEWFNTLS